MFTKIFFVRHAQPEHAWDDDRTRPLTAEGISDSDFVTEVLRDKKIDIFYSSPYRRSVDTIQKTADLFSMEIHLDERLREREKGPNGNNLGMFQKRWADHEYNEDGGESIAMVQKRNIEALHEIIDKNSGKNIVAGTHGTALSSIINYHIPEFGCDDFLRIIDWMPYILEMDFDGRRLVSMAELGHIEKEFKGKSRADRAGGRG